MAATGRVRDVSGGSGVAMMPAEEKAAILDTLVEERMDQIDALARLLKPLHRQLRRLPVSAVLKLSLLAWSHRTAFVPQLGNADATPPLQAPR
jgi:hypothetical protein